MIPQNPPPGTLLRLVDNAGLASKVGAYALAMTREHFSGAFTQLIEKVGKAAAYESFVPVSWIDSDVQQDGFYVSYRFSVVGKAGLKT